MAGNGLRFALVITITGVVFCWSGGMRSQGADEHNAEAGKSNPPREVTYKDVMAIKLKFLSGMYRVDGPKTATVTVRVKVSSTREDVNACLAWPGAYNVNSPQAYPLAWGCGPDPNLPELQLRKVTAEAQEVTVGLNHVEFLLTPEQMMGDKPVVFRMRYHCYEKGIFDKEGNLVNDGPMVRSNWVDCKVVREVSREELAMRVPDGFQAKPLTTSVLDAGTTRAKEVIHKKTGMELVFIPAGEFMMGSPEGEANRHPDEGPIHRVRITKAFYMGKYEVTQGEWRKVMGKNPSGFKGSDPLPVDSVTWKGCEEFCKKAGNGLCLPTEAQWEYACRAGTKTAYSFGDDERDLDAYAWYGSVYSHDKTHEVGEKRPNAWGLHDMYGNVREWCSDWYDERYYGKSPAADPQGPEKGSVHVLRGGSWLDNPPICRSASRATWRDDVEYPGNGVRVIVDLR